jgi:glutamate synthase domain-containing protein 1
MLVGMPHSYYSRVVMEELSIDLGVPDSYGTGIVFLPQNNTSSIEAIKEIFQSQAENIGLEILGWRAVMTGTNVLYLMDGWMDGFIVMMMMMMRVDSSLIIDDFNSYDILYKSDRHKTLLYILYLLISMLS